MLEFLIRNFKSFRNEQDLKRYILSKPDYHELIGTLKLLTSKGFNYRSFCFIKDYIINETNSDLDSILELKPAFDIAIDESIILKVMERKRLSFDWMVYSLKKKIQSEKVISYFFESKNYFSDEHFSIKRVSILLDDCDLESDLKDVIINKLLCKNLELQQYRTLLKNCQYARTQKKLIEDFVYRLEIDKMFLQIDEKKAALNALQESRIPQQPNANHNQSNLVDNLLLLGTGYAIGSLLTNDDQY